ncbi:MAG: serine hydrolase [Spirochaetaceae bacterium]|nr:serine hydrolase [Spirochaetaceae bacterium]
MITPTHADVAPNIELLSAWIEAQMAHRAEPGLSIGIVHDQELVWAHGFGHAHLDNRVAATADTRYRIASVTKLFTGTAILILRDAGMLQLDDPVDRHLPWFDIRQRYPDTPPITIRHLLTHTAGLPREAAFPYWTDADFPTREQVREALPRQETAYPTETRWKYSNLALVLTGEIVAAVSGQAYEDFVQQRILAPLGMSDTLVRGPRPDDPRLAVGYGRRLPGTGRAVLSPSIDYRGITPAANMTSTVADLAKFAMLQFRDGPAGGDQVLRGSTLREMQRVHWLDPDWKQGWGLGFRVTRQDDATCIGHGGWAPGYRAQMLLCPADRTGVIVLSNAHDCDAVRYCDRAFQWVLPAVARAAPEPRPATPDPGWQRYVGRYRDAWSDTQVLVHNGELVAVDPSADDPLETRATLTPVAEHTFRYESGNGFRSRGELAVFEVDDAGRVQRLKLDENYTYPVPDWHAPAAGLSGERE